MQALLRRLGATVGTIVIAASLAACDPAVVAPSDPPRASPTPSAVPDETVRRSIEFRELVGLRADEAWVREVASDPAHVTTFGVPLTVAEAAALDARPRSFHDVAEAVRAYGAQHADEFGGIFAKAPGATGLVAAFTGHLDVHQAALAKVVHPASELELRQVQTAERDLHALMERIVADADPLRTFGIFVVTTGANEQEGVVHVELSTKREDAGEVMGLLYGPLVVARVLDPTGAYLEPPGRVSGRVIDEDGKPVQAQLGLTPLFADIPMDAVGRGTAPDGTFREPQLLPGRWRITAETTDGEAATGLVEFDLPPGAHVEVEIIVRRP